MKIKAILFTVLFIFLFYASIFIAGFIPFIAEYKLEISTEAIMDYTKNVFLHPIMNIKEMHAAENPILYISMIAAFLLFVYLLIKSKAKNYENVGEKYGVQGSSRWAKHSEIFKVPDQITVVSSKEMFSELNKALNKDVVQ